MPSKLHERLKYARERAGLSQATIAEELGLTRNAVSLWEQANESTRTQPGVWQLLTFCRMTSVDMVAYMLNDDADVEDIVPMGSVYGDELALANALTVVFEAKPEVLDAAQALCQPPGGALKAAKLLLATRRPPTGSNGG